MIMGVVLLWVVVLPFLGLVNQPIKGSFSDELLIRLGGMPK